MTPASRRSLAVGTLALSLIACDAGTGSTGPGTAARLTLPPPALSGRAVDPDALDVAVTVGGVGASVTVGSDGERVATIDVPTGEPLLVEITWVDRSGDRPVPLFALTSELGPLSADAAMRIETPYRNLDADGDGESNLAALEAGRDPFAARRDAQLGNRAVMIPRLDPDLAPPEIDGRYDDGGVWSGARFSDVGKRLLHIDNLLIDRGAEAADGEPMYRWAAMHDGESLYLSVAFEGARDSDSGDASRDAREYTPTRDSEAVFEDDALNVFLDGDDSRRRGLDGVNDVYLQIPQVGTDGTGAGVMARRPFAPDPDGSLDGIEVGSCVCRDGVSRWELKIPLSLIDVEVGRPFGIELQIDQDRDGGNREARWGWANPSIAERREDFRFESPALNGTAMLMDGQKDGQRDDRPEEPAEGAEEQPAGSRSGALIVRHSGKCIDVRGALSENGTNVHQWDCFGNPNQRFDARETSDGSVQLVAAHSERCLDVDEGTVDDGGNVQQWSCSGALHQRFELRGREGGWFDVVARHSGLCLSVEGGSTETSANIVQSVCDGSAHQQFRFA